jgi:uncharacterized membrane protein
MKMRREKEEKEERIGHLPYSYEAVQDERCSEEALRKLSRSIEEVRLHSQHRQICACVYMCFLFVLTRFFSHTQKRPLVYVLRIIISFFSHCRSEIFYWLKGKLLFIGSQNKRKKNIRGGERETWRMKYLSSIVNQQYTLVTINLLIRLIMAQREKNTSVKS